MSVEFIEPSVYLMDYKHLGIVENALTKVEECARTCYKSEGKKNLSISRKEECAKFVLMLIKHTHYAMLEHAVFTFKVSNDLYDSIKGAYIPFVKLTSVAGRNLVTINLRTLLEVKLPAFQSFIWCIIRDQFFEDDTNYPKILELRETLSLGIDIRLNWSEDCELVDFDEIEGLTETEMLAHKHFTFRIITDRGVTHELVRHRMASYAQESTRYCNYSGNLQIVLPTTFSEWNKLTKVLFKSLMGMIATYYTVFIEDGLTPQLARAILPNCVKTEICITANVAEYCHILDLRLTGVTGKPHPDIRYVMSITWQNWLSAYFKKMQSRRNNA